MRCCAWCLLQVARSTAEELNQQTEKMGCTFALSLRCCRCALIALTVLLLAVCCAAMIDELCKIENQVVRALHAQQRVVSRC